MKRLAAGLLVSTFLLAGATVFDAAPAGACSCEVGSDADAVARADAVFVGEVVDYEGPDRSGSFSSVDPALWTFSVSRVYKGAVTATQPVVSEVSGASCGLEIPKSGEFLVFAQTRGSGSFADPEPGQLYAGLCGGTRAMSDGGLHPSLASAHPPVRGSGPTPEARTLTGTVNSSSGSPPAAIAGVAIVAVLVIGLVLVVHHRRRAAAPLD